MRHTFLALLLAATPLLAQEKPIDTQRSTITVHVGKAGLLSMAGHDHWISAAIASGVIDEAAGRVEFKVATASMKVRPDPNVDAKTRATIQKDMEDMTLETAKYPEISFRSTGINKVSEGQYKVDGMLSLHGVSKPVTVTVNRDGGSFTGRAVITQTDFGIKPISVAGGTIRVQNAVEVTFAIFR